MYETIHSFKTMKSAKDWVNTYQDSGKAYPHIHSISPPPGAHGGVNWAGTMGPAKPTIERDVYYHVRYGDRVLELSFRGGAAITPSFVQPYWRVALQRFTSSCTLRA
jgi:hypothetical protein